MLRAEPDELLGPLVEGTGGVLVDAVREDVSYRPRRGAHVRYAATVERDGVARREGWVVSAGGPQTSATLSLEGPQGRLTAWRVRDDPLLPGLRPALEVPAVAALLSELGVPPDGLELRLLAYRPQRRAVVSATTPTHQLFLKCVPTDRSGALHRRHRACRDAGLPVPRALAHDAALGLLVLSPLHGSPLRASLLADAATLPAAEDVAGLLDAFGDVDLDEPARSPVRQVRGHAALLGTLLPAEAARCDELVDRIRAVCDSVADADLRTVHGDLHDDQLLVLDGRLTGVVDIDGAGRGHPADDAANLLAHLLVLRDLTPKGTVHGWLPAMQAALAARHDHEQLQARTAAVLVGLATWPHSRQAVDWPARTGEILTLAAHVLAGQW